MKSIVRAALLAAAVAAAAQGVLAHGDKSNAKIDYSKAEEKPFGRAADPRRARTIVVGMSDEMRYAPAEITVKKGDTVRFVLTNQGKVMHEFVLGTMEELKEHAGLMKKHPGMEHNEPHMAHVAPGKSEVMGWQFTKAGEFYFGCLVPGHWEAGMRGRIRVID